MSDGEKIERTDRDRLASLEARGRHYDAEFDRLNSAVAGLDRKMESGFDRMTREIRAQAESRRITWPLIFTAVGTIAGMVGVAAAFHAQSLRPLSAAIELNREAMREHEEKPAHPEALAEAEALGERVLAVKEDLAEWKGEVGRRVDEVREVVEDHAAEADHPFGVLAKFERLSGEMVGVRQDVEELRRLIQEVDRFGSRRWIVPANPAAGSN